MGRSPVWSAEVFGGEELLSLPASGKGLAAGEAESFSESTSGLACVAGESIPASVSGFAAAKTVSFPGAAGADCALASGRAPARTSARYNPKALEDPLLTACSPECLSQFKSKNLTYTAAPVNAIYFDH